MKKNYNAPPKEHTYEDNNADLPLSKWQKKTESLQDLICIRPDLKGKKVVKGDCKFDTFSKWLDYLQGRGVFKGRRSAIATIFLEANPTMQEKYLPFPIKEMRRTLDEIINIIRYVFSISICYGQSTHDFESITHVRGTQLVSNNKDHTPFALMERKGQLDEAYRRIDCTLKRILAGTNSAKAIHASKEILIEKRLEEKIKKEEVEVSDKIANITHIITKDVINKNINFSTLHPIFQELIRIQTGKLNGIRYHPMFLRWAITVYSRSGHAAYDAMKTIMRLPSISTLKSYINECKQKSGLLWSQRENCYVGYLDFENEMQDYQAFAIQCQQEIESISTENNSDKGEQKYGLATQVHQFVWHSIIHNFAFPISYYGINNITAHSLNTLIFSLAAKLECIGVHTCGSICDGAGENRTHIKSFDWYASKWSFGDLVEINFNKDKRSFHTAKIIDSNFERTKFIVCQLDCENPKKIEIERNFICPPMPLKLEWNINELFESTLSVEIENTKEGWKVFNYHISKFLRPIYNNQSLSANYKTINPITGEDWFFISDPTHLETYKRCI
ncbi:hypothetical protein C1645_840138 [Glomus cerebriforme]|uniref:Transposable element P transposase-like RNase H domain-containing protein n=1 Tax=Glomus cerebriforme TaxID=658196 RepID=A0A397S4N6_9GLOM|nr:hypothetical protein C1645_840138 [Glomus cerebriforme]